MFLWRSRDHVHGGVGILRHRNSFRRARRSTGDGGRGGAGRGGEVYHLARLTRESPGQ